MSQRICTMLEAARSELQQGEFLFSEGRVEEARQCFLGIIAQDPRSRDAYNNLGVIAFARQDLQGALGFFFKALEIDPSYKQATINLSAVLHASGDLPRAISVLEKALRIRPGDEDLQEVLKTIQACEPRSGVKNPAQALRSPVQKDFPRGADNKDPFLRLVDQDAVSRKTGFNVLIYADMNIAGQLTQLCRALNRYTPHKARCVIYQDDYLHYDRDIVVRDEHGRLLVSDFSEIQELVRRADIFHIGRQALNLPGVDFSHVLHQHNCLVQYFGSDLRLNHEKLFLWHLKKSIPALVGYGWTLSYPLPMKFYHIQQFFDPSPFKRVKWLKPGDRVRVVHAPTDRAIKRTDLFLEIMSRLQKEFNVEVDVIEKVSNQECMARKQQGHITYDEMGTPTFGLNSIESMAMGHVCLSSVNPHVLSYFPDTPVVRITENTLELMLRKLLGDVELINRIGDLSYEFVRRHYNVKTSAIRFSHLYSGIKHGYFHCDPGLPLELECA